MPNAMAYTLALALSSPFVTFSLMYVDEAELLCVLAVLLMVGVTAAGAGLRAFFEWRDEGRLVRNAQFWLDVTEFARLLLQYYALGVATGLILATITQWPRPPIPDLVLYLFVVLLVLLLAVVPQLMTVAGA